MISANKEKLLIELSERKNISSEHYKVMANISSYDDSIASYIIDEIKGLSNVAKNDFNINRQITANPNYYLNLKKQEAEKDKDLWINHYARLVSDKTLGVQFRAIAYLTLYEHKVIYDKELDAELEKFLKDNDIKVGK